MGTSPVPSRGPKIGRNCHLIRVFLGVPRKGNQMISGYITPAFLGFPVVGRHEQETKWCPSRFWGHY